MSVGSCPLCGSELIAFAHIETIMPGGQRATDGILSTVGSFFSRARDSLLSELREPNEKDDVDLENEI